MTPKDAAKYIEAFLDGTGNEWDWDDFLHAQITDPQVDEIRQICAGLHDLYPAHKKGEYCNSKGETILRALCKELQSMC